jgi:hypothetical protein
VESTGKHEVNHALRNFNAESMGKIDLFKAAQKAAE